MSTEKSLPPETILIVGDTPENITILSSILKKKYQVIAAPSGEAAIRILQSGSKPDLILLDIIMPGMNGYELCQKIMEHPAWKEVPVMFTSSLSETEDIIRGFQVGAVDYVTKPYRSEEIFARVEVHLQLKRAKGEIQSLLSKTLLGTIKLLVEILTVTQPALVQQTGRMRGYIKEILKKLAITPQSALDIELAALLSHIGCISMPSELLRKIMSGGKLSAEERERYLQYPVLGSKLIENIPRLEKTAAIIRNQLTPPGQLPFLPGEAEYTGSILLNILTAYNLLANNGVGGEYAFSRIRQQLPGCPEYLLEAFHLVLEEEQQQPEKRIPVAELQPGMVLSENVKLKDGTLLLPKGTELSENLVDLVQRFTTQGLCVMKEILMTVAQA